MTCITLPETNISSLKISHLQKEDHLLTIDFRGLCWFQGGYIITYNHIRNKTYFHCFNGKYLVIDPSQSHCFFGVAVWEKLIDARKVSILKGIQFSVVAHNYQ